MKIKLPHGAIEHIVSDRKTDYLYRVSMKGLVFNDKHEVLVVKESGRSTWDLPGGGMDHGEGIHDAIARELHEEISLMGNFEHQIICVDEPMFLENHKLWQMRLIFKIIPECMEFLPGVDSDLIALINPQTLKDSAHEVERKVYEYACLAA